MTTDDQRLHRRLVQGDRTAGTEIYRRHHGSVERRCRAVLGDADLAQDVTQEVFLELLTRPDRLDPERGNLASYLGLLARRRSIDLIRRRERARDREERAAQLDTRADHVDPGPDELALDLDVRRAVASLPKLQQTVVGWAFYGQLTYQEAAAELGIAVGTAKSRIRLALARLRLEPDLLPPMP